MSRKRVAVLISGRGSNMAALIEAAKDKNYPAEIALVLSNRPDAGGLGTRARGRHRHRGRRSCRVRQGPRRVRARAAGGAGQAPHRSRLPRRLHAAAHARLRRRNGTGACSISIRRCCRRSRASTPTSARSKRARKSTARRCISWCRKWIPARSSRRARLQCAPTTARRRSPRACSGRAPHLSAGAQAGGGRPRAGRRRPLPDRRRAGARCRHARSVGLNFPHKFNVNIRPRPRCYCRDTPPVRAAEHNTGSDAMNGQARQRAETDFSGISRILRGGLRSLVSDDPRHRRRHFARTRLGQDQSGMLTPACRLSWPESDSSLGTPLAYVMFINETVGAVCIILGLFTRFFAASIAIELAVDHFGRACCQADLACRWRIRIPADLGHHHVRDRAARRRPLLARPQDRQGTLGSARSRHRLRLPTATACPLGMNGPTGIARCCARDHHRD